MQIVWNSLAQVYHLLIRFHIGGDEYNSPAD